MLCVYTANITKRRTEPHRAKEQRRTSRTANKAAQPAAPATAPKLHKKRQTESKPERLHHRSRSKQLPQAAPLTHRNTLTAPIPLEQYLFFVFINLIFWLFFRRNSRKSKGFPPNFKKFFQPDSRKSINSRKSNKKAKLGESRVPKGQTRSKSNNRKSRLNLRISLNFDKAHR